MKGDKRRKKKNLFHLSMSENHAFLIIFLEFLLSLTMNVKDLIKAIFITDLNYVEFCVLHIIATVLIAVLLL